MPLIATPTMSDHAYVRVRPVCPKPVIDVRMMSGWIFVQPVVAEPERVEVAGLERLDDDVRRRDQLLEQRRAPPAS